MINDKTKTALDYAVIAVFFVFTAALVFVLSQLNIGRYLPDFGTTVSPLAALVIGLVASVSTCLAMVGGLVMSFGETQNKFKAHLHFHLGRLVGFMVLGGMLGVIGSKVNYSVAFTGVLTIAVSVVMAYIGLQTLGFLPNITRLGFHLPLCLSGNVSRKQAPIILGVMTFFLPCGFTQSMQLAAVTSSGFISGALIMGFFALGTFPVLLGIGMGATYASRHHIKYLNYFMGVVILFFALYSFKSGLVLSGSKFNFKFWDSGRWAISSEISDKIQVAKMDIDWVYSPSELKVKKGIPVRWEINAKSLNGCSRQIVIPSMNILKTLELGLNVIEFTPKKAGILPFSCSMGMMQGRFIVTP